MKKLITVNEVKEALDQSEKIIYVEPGTIITPAAKDAANEWNITFIARNPPAEAIDSCCLQEKKTHIEEKTASNIAGIDPDLIKKIVKEVIVSLQEGVSKQIVKESDQCGLCLVRGESVECESFDTGNPKDKVGIKRVLYGKESSNIIVGFKTIENSCLDYTLQDDEFNYILEGTLELTINDKKYCGKAGDVFYIPKDICINYFAKNKVKMFFIAHPIN